MDTHTQIIEWLILSEYKLQQLPLFVFLSHCDDPLDYNCKAEAFQLNCLYVN